MNPSTVIALGLALASTVLINIAYLIEHDAAAALPVLTIRRPLQSVRALLSDRSWLLGFGMESAGFLLYVGALRLASLALVQSVAAGGIGLLAFVSSRVNRRPLGSRERSGVLLSMFGLVVLAVSLVGGSGEGGAGSTVAIVIWLAATAAVAVSAVTLGRRMLGVAVAEGVAGGLFFSLGDVSTKVATQGGARFVFVVPLIIGYTLGTWLLQLGYQRGGALTVAGLATLLTNAVPIAASMLVLGEPVPSGAYGALRVLAFAAVTIGAILLARPEREPAI
ncbi:MAG: hypothetical protein QOH23_2231 [Gaiellaceae bacterium]|nr:hypothetical protein [Gaiellaceae bacterium]